MPTILPSTKEELTESLNEMQHVFWRFCRMALISRPPLLDILILLIWHSVQTLEFSVSSSDNLNLQPGLRGTDSVTYYKFKTFSDGRLHIPTRCIVAIAQ